MLSPLFCLVCCGLVPFRWGHTMLATVVVVVMDPTLDSPVFSHVPSETVIILQHGCIRVAMDVLPIIFVLGHLLYFEPRRRPVDVQAVGLEQGLLLGIALPVRCIARILTRIWLTGSMVDHSVQNLHVICVILVTMHPCCSLRRQEKLKEHKDLEALESHHDFTRESNVV